MLIYVAGPYGPKTAHQTDVDVALMRPESARIIEENVAHAVTVAARLWDAGHAVICPHANTHAVSLETVSMVHQRWLDGDFQMIAVCDAIYMLDGWQDSRGARAELEYAQQLGLLVYEEPVEVPLHPTEVRCPIQATAFREAVGRMYRVHLQKNADYSPANILATGQIGLVTRLWDKTARLLNLSGFRIEIASASFDAPREPRHEAISDTLEDLAVYAVIGKLLRSGAWGQ